MGLMYLFPTEAGDPDHIIEQGEDITLRSYGLPPIFWLYLLGILTMFTLISAGAYGPLSKLLSYQDFLSQLIGYALVAFLVLLPLVTLSFYFYEKRISRQKNNLVVTHRVFFLPLKSKTYSLDEYKISIEQYIDSPNMARLQGGKEMRGFQNKGYFQLLLKSNAETIILDRHSRKADLIKIAQLLRLNIA